MHGAEYGQGIHIGFILRLNNISTYINDSGHIYNHVLLYIGHVIFIDFHKHLSTK